MTEPQTKHISDMIEALGDRMFDKYSRGTEEHEGNLWEVDSLELLDMAIDEAIDQCVYLLTLKQRLEGERQ